ncbi:hypothetical protein [Acetobacterium carbinolicum]|uniref:hypothetical protein n=1 Tax=Acetobacterium carbinolicum TaxID=52690 RepID=UPI0039C9D086
MRLEKNWFYQLCLSLAIVGLLYILIAGVSSIGDGQEYSYFLKGLLILGLFALWLIVQFTAMIAARFKLAERLDVNKKYVRIGEYVFVFIILAVALAVRIMVINKIPMQVESDYKTYYEIADLLKQGTLIKEGKGYCNYIAMFPHVMGYCYILKTVFTWFGTSVVVGQYLNIFFSIATIVIVYRIGRALGGRIAGIIALLGTAFWPSQVLYITMLSAEYVFTFLLYGSILLFIYLAKGSNENISEAVIGMTLHVILGGIIAVAAAVRPMAIILLVAIIICLVPQKMKTSAMPRNDIPLAIRFLEKGWQRCVLIIIPYLIVSSFITTNIEATINKELPSASTSFGYNLLVGLNAESKGGWNDEDAKLLYDSMDATGSATQAHIACRDLAFVRLTSYPQKIFNLMVEKYELLWGNDDYGSTWNIAFLQEQGELTKARSDFLYTARDDNNIIYLSTVFFALIALIYLMKKDGSYAYTLILVFLGTAGMHLFVESQNRYHYFVLQVFIILAGLAIHFIFADGRKKVVELQKNKSDKEISLKTENEKTQIEKIVQERLKKIRKEEMSNTFNMEEAIKNKHVIMTVSEAYHTGKDQDDKTKNL